MRQTLSRGVLAAAAASGILSLSCSSALADSHAVGGAQDSPGVLAGNNVQVPVEVPVNVCGNTVNGVALLNSATGNACANAASPTRGAGVTPSAGGSSTGSQAVGGAQDSPGVLAGNNVQVPVKVPVNVCGNTVGGVALLNSATGNACANAASPTPGARETPSAGGSSTGSQAVGGAQDSPGVLAGNNVQVP
ncbi:chaplin, partial [Streptomyces cinerochromogenes]